MKKAVFFLLIVIIITGCSKSKRTRTMTDLLDEYVNAYTKADVGITRDIFPQYYVEYSKEYMTKSYMEKNLEDAKVEYGDDFNIVYNITKETQLTDDELDKFNKKMAENFNTEAKAIECYKYDGTITFKGSNKQEEGSIASMGYCKYDEFWYLVRY